MTFTLQSSIVNHSIRLNIEAFFTSSNLRVVEHRGFGKQCWRHDEALGCVSQSVCHCHAAPQFVVVTACAKVHHLCDASGQYARLQLTELLQKFLHTSNLQHQRTIQTISPCNNQKMNLTNFTAFQKTDHSLLEGAGVSDFATLANSRD